MFSTEECDVLRTLNDFMSTVRPLDGGRYTTVMVPIPLMQKLINFHDAHAPEAILEPVEHKTEPKAQTIPPPPEVERAMKTLARIWEPQVVSCAHCSAHMALQNKEDLAHFIDIHEKCG